MASVTRREDTDRDNGAENAIVLPDRSVPACLGGNGTAAVSVSNEVYSRKAVLAAAYKLSDRCAVLVDTDGDKRWALFLIGSAETDTRLLIEALVRELGDQALREQLEDQFGAVRTLIVAQAFSEGNLLDPDRDDTDHNADARGTGERR
jgi:His-Xaa-Ser system protein HxsD